MQQFESFAQMQRDAAMRVMEMQRRAQTAVRNTEPMNGQIAEDCPLCEPETKQNISPKEQHENIKPEISQEETERALITAILLLLMRENADERLIFALLYILL